MRCDGWLVGWCEFLFSFWAKRGVKMVVAAEYRTENQSDSFIFNPWVIVKIDSSLVLSHL